MIALVIPVEGPLVEVELDGSLDQLQRLVGGWIQMVPLPGFIDGAERAAAYVNEEGKLTEHQANRRATDYMVPGAHLLPGDYIAGPLVLCGFDAESGEHADLPPAVIARARLIEQEAG